MADNRYGGYGRNEGWRQREGSIFSDDNDRRSRGSSERWSGGRGSDDDRGFFERAGDEVRSWFGDEEAERRRESDMRRDEGSGEQGWRGQYRSNEGGRDYGRGWESGGSRSSYGSGGYGGSERGRSSSDWVGGGSMSGSSRDQGSYGQRSFSGRSGMAGRSQWDENYRRWRDEQISQFDREYDDYCRERQQQFEQDFDSWRTSRLTESGGSGQYGGASSSGETVPRSTGKSTSGGGSQTTASEKGSATTAGGGGTGSAMESSTGSSGGSGGRSRSRT